MNFNRRKYVFNAIRENKILVKISEFTVSFSDFQSVQQPIFIVCLCLTPHQQLWSYVGGAMA